MAKVKRTRNAATWTEAQYWGRVRSSLRKTFAYWLPAQQAAKRAECGTRINPATGRMKKIYRCAACGEASFREEMQLDHVDACGSLRCAEDLAPFLKRLTCEDVEKYQLLHKKCHQERTNKQQRT